MHHHDHHVGSDNLTARRLGWAIAVNALIVVAELVGGWVTGFLALTADAIHNASDVAALIIALLALKATALPATKRSTFGWQRVEVLTGFVSAVTLLVIAVFIVIEAIERFANPVPLRQPGLLLTIALVGLIGNVVAVLLLHRSRDQSLNMRAAWLHLVFDTLSSVIVILGGVLVYFTGISYVDPILSLVIAIMLVWSSYQVIREATFVLLEAVPSRMNYDDVANAIRELPRVCDVHDLHIWSLSSREAALSCHVVVAIDDLTAGPDIAVSVCDMVERSFGIGHSTVQIERETCRQDCARSGNEADC